MLNSLFMFDISGVIPGLGFNGIALAAVLGQSEVALYLLFKIFGRAMMQDLRCCESVPAPAKYLEIANQPLRKSLALFSLRVEQLFLLPTVAAAVGTGLIMSLLVVRQVAHGKIGGRAFLDAKLCCKLHIICNQNRHLDCLADHHSEKCCHSIKRRHIE